MLSKTTRFALIALTAWAKRMNRPSRLYSPVSAIWFRSTETKSTNSFLRLASSRKSKPSDATLASSFASVSSKSMHTPGSPYRTAPCTRNSIANKLLPHPVLPHTRVTRPFGRPPPVTSSNPWIPVGALASDERRTFGLAPGIARLLNGNFQVRHPTYASYPYLRPRYNELGAKADSGEIATDLMPRTDGPQMGLAGSGRRGSGWIVGNTEVILSPDKYRTSPVSALITLRHSHGASRRAARQGYRDRGSRLQISG